jgi:hypothetical protein
MIASVHAEALDVRADEALDQLQVVGGGGGGPPPRGVGEAGGNPPPRGVIYPVVVGF